MLQAIVDYKEVWDVSIKWMKKHWLGYSAFCLILLAGPIIWCERDSIVDNMKGLKKKITG